MEWKPHVTVAAVIHDKGKYLFVEEKVNNKAVINQPAGHLEKDETLIEAVVREVREETGGIFEPIGLVGIYHYFSKTENITYIRFCYYGSCSTFTNDLELDKVIIRTLWLSKDELCSYSSSLRSPLVTRCIDDFESGKLLSLDVIK